MKPKIAIANSSAATLEASGAKPIFDSKPFAWASVGVCIFYVFARIYQQYFGWYAGLDAYDPKFATYWMQILWTVLPLEVIVFNSIVSYLWKTRDKDLANVAPREELRRFFYLLSWIGVYAVAIYWGASYFTEQDGASRQTVIRDTAFTPTHIIEFYINYPIYIIIGVGGFVYARTRLPIFGLKGYSIAYLLLFVSPFMIFPYLALNEWGHVFGVREELFGAPLHSVLVLFGWFALAVFGVSLQILGRMGELYNGHEDLFGLEPSYHKQDSVEERKDATAVAQPRPPFDKLRDGPAIVVFAAALSAAVSLVLVPLLKISGPLLATIAFAGFVGLVAATFTFYFINRHHLLKIFHNFFGIARRLRTTCLLVFEYSYSTIRQIMALLRNIIILILHPLTQRKVESAMPTTQLDVRAIEIVSAFVLCLTIFGFFIGFFFPGRVTGAILPIALTFWWALYKTIQQLEL